MRRRPLPSMYWRVMSSFKKLLMRRSWALAKLDKKGLQFAWWERDQIPKYKHRIASEQLSAAHQCPAEMALCPTKSPRLRAPHVFASADYHCSSSLCRLVSFLTLGEPSAPSDKLIWIAPCSRRRDSGSTHMHAHMWQSRQHSGCTC